MCFQRWSPYVVGIGIGILSWLTFLLSDHPIGCSGAYSQTSGMIEKALRGEAKVSDKPYYKKIVPKIDWEWMLVLGVVVGAFFSVVFSGEFNLTMVPEMWREHFGSGWGNRWFFALIGGFILAVGARWAGGCTSGHGLSGTMQLAASSWLAVISFFAGGVLTALIIMNVF